MGLEDYKYDPLTGKFYNKFGKEIGSYTKKYGRALIEGKEVQLARLAFRLMTGEWPEHTMDHIDRNPHNNKWDNLRHCTQADNMKNRSTYKSNTTGYKGVYTRYDKFIAQIQDGGSRIYLGIFESSEAAAEAYNVAAAKYHGEYANLNQIKGNV